MKQIHSVILLLAASAALLGWRVFAQIHSTAPSAPLAPTNISAPGDGRLTYTTPNTMRLAGPNVYAAAKAIT